ncbi:MAG: hypothetical protein IIC76_14905 [Bacteroidetes bacterium]|nr:hypothetical protein [Bacteroidota bacterium]
MTEQEGFEQLIGYVADQRKALEKGEAIDDTDLYNIEVLLIRLQDQCANNRLKKININ